MFDTAVNTDPAQAAHLLQRIVDVPADSAIGLKTIAAVNDYVATHGLPVLIEAYTEARHNLLPLATDLCALWRRLAQACDACR